LANTVRLFPITFAPNTRGQFPQEREPLEYA
jgi:hypothetical protein